MKKMNKKGFTIVELVIVIAVIAILAAVIIPTFSGVVEKANQSAALQACRNELVEMKVAYATQGGDIVEGTIFSSKGYYFEYKDGELKKVDNAGSLQESKLENISIYQKNGAVVYGKNEAATELTGRGVTAGNPTVAISCAASIVSDTKVKLVLYKDGAVFYESEATLSSNWTHGNFIVSLYDTTGSYVENGSEHPWKIQPASIEAAAGYYTFDLTIGTETTHGMFYYNGK